MRKLEKSHENGFVTWLVQYAEWEAIKINRRGWPDRMIIGPYHVCYFIEFKRDVDEELRKLQVHFKDFLEQLGFKVYVCRSAEEAKEITRKYIYA